MKKTLLFLFVLLISSTFVEAQLTLTGTSYTQNFNDSMLPTGWSTRTGATTTTRGTTSTPAMKNTWSSSTGEFRFCASAKSPLSASSTTTSQNAATDRVLAVRPTGSFGDPGQSFNLQLSNTTSRTNFSLSFAVQLLDIQSRTTQYRVDYGKGTAPSTFTQVGSVFKDSATNGHTWGQDTLTFSFGSAIDTSFTNIWIRIVCVNATTGSGNRSSFGIDDVVLTWTNLPPVITTSGTIHNINTTYGTASSVDSFFTAGTNMTTGITVTPPTAFEVSTSRTTGFASSVTIGSSGTIASTKVYYRLKSTATPATYLDNIVLSSTDATIVNVSSASDTVRTKNLTITGLSANNKVYDASTAASYTGGTLVGILGSDVVSFTGSANFASPNVGTAISVSTALSLSGAQAAYYTLTQPTGLSANITKASQTITFNALSDKCAGGTSYTLTATASSGLTVWFSSATTSVVSIAGTTATTGIAGTSVITATQAGNSNYNAATAVLQTQTVVINPVGPSLLSKTPNTSTFCLGTAVSATFNAGTGGSGCGDEYIVSIDGATPTSYTPGTAVGVTAIHNVIIQGRRASCLASAGCTGTSYQTLASWSVDTTLPSITTQPSPSTTSLCQGASFDLSVVASGYVSAYQWKINGTNISGATASTLHIANVDTNNVGNYSVAITGVCNTVNSNNAGLTVKNAANNIVLADAALSATTLAEGCEVSGWTYYVDPSNDNKWIFAIDWNGNTAAKAIAQVKINVLPGAITSEVTRSSGYKDAAYILNRYWNVDIGSTGLSNPVKVKFYYDQVEIDTITALRDRRMNELNAPTPAVYSPVPLKWFKTVGMQFTPSLINDGNSFDAFANITLNPAAMGFENGVSFVQFENITSFSGGTVGLGYSPNAGAALPVTLTSLEAIPVQKSYIQVKWTTVLEINNSGFNVMRSEDGNTFTKVAFVTGHNNSTITNNYSFDDKQATLGKTYYYKLTQIDNDGKATDSKIVNATITTDKGFEASEFYPNPSVQTTSLDLFNVTNKEVNIKIYDMLGNLISSETNTLTKGSNKLSLHTNTLAEGTYTALITIDGQNMLVKKLLVAH